MEFANRLGDRGIVMEALKWVGQTMLYRADFAGARDRLAMAVDQYDSPENKRDWAAYTNTDPRVANRCHLAMSLWHLGFPDQALITNREMRELARAIGHPFTLAYALHHTGLLQQCCRLGVEVQAAGEESFAISTEQGFAWWTASGTFYKGAGLLLQGQLEEAIPLIRKGVHAWRATGAELILPVQLSALGDAYTQAGRFEDCARRWTRDWQSRRGTTSVSRRPSCTASKASCCWRSRRTRPLPQRNASAVPSRSPDTSGAGPGSCGPR